MYGVDPYSLHVLNPHFRPRDGTQESYLFHISFDARATTCIYMHTSRRQKVNFWTTSHDPNWKNKTYTLKRSINQKINVVQGQHCPILIIHLWCSKYNLHNTTSRIYTYVLRNN